MTTNKLGTILLMCFLIAIGMLCAFFACTFVHAVLNLSLVAFLLVFNGYNWFHEKK